MTEALLGVYPDVFMAGVSLMGVPCGCWAESYNDVIGTGSIAQWSGPCAGGNVTKTGQEWGDLVRSYYPGYTGHRPRLQHWHGTDDSILSYNNVAEDIKEWTNLLGLTETPTGTDTPAIGTSRQFWNNSCGYTVYEAFSLAGVGHSVPFDGNAVATYFGLDRAGGPDPEAAACPDDGSGGAGGGGGTGGTGGIGDAGVTDGGPLAGQGGAVSGSGGAGEGGSAGAAIEAGTGGSGLAGTGGSAPAGTGGVSGGTAAIAGTGEQGGNSANGNWIPPTSSSSGCSCTVGIHARRSSADVGALLLAALGLLFVRVNRRA
jgi:MYXO-CTERM domain-containing protein